jgi:hypothetical protein
MVGSDFWEGTDVSSSSYAQQRRTASLLMIVKTISRMILKMYIPQQQISAKVPFVPE